MADSYGAAPIIEAGLNEITSQIDEDTKTDGQAVLQAAENLTKTVQKMRRILVKAYQEITNQTLSRSSILRQPGQIFDVWGGRKDQRSFTGDFKTLKKSLRLEIDALTYEFSHNFVQFLNAIDMFNLKTPKLVYVWHSEDYKDIRLYEEKNIDDDKQASILANVKNLGSLVDAGNKFIEDNMLASNLLRRNEQVKKSQKYPLIQNAYQNSSTRSERKGTHGFVLTLWIQDGAWAKAWSRGWGFFAEAFTGFVYAANEDPESLSGLFESIDREILVGDFMTGSPSNVRSTLFATKQGEELNEEFQKNPQGVMTGDSTSGALVGDRGHRQVKSLGGGLSGIADIISYMKKLDVNYKELEKVVRAEEDTIYRKFIKPKGFQNNVVAHEGGNWATMQIDLVLEKRIKDKLSAFVELS